MLCYASKQILLRKGLKAAEVPLQLYKDFWPQRLDFHHLKPIKKSCNTTKEVICPVMNTSWMDWLDFKDSDKVWIMYNISRKIILVITDRSDFSIKTWHIFPSRQIFEDYLAPGFKSRKSQSLKIVLKSLILQAKRATFVFEIFEFSRQKWLFLKYRNFKENRKIGKVEKLLHKRHLRLF